MTRNLCLGDQAQSKTAGNIEQQIFERSIYYKLGG